MTEALSASSSRSSEGLRGLALRLALPALIVAGLLLRLPGLDGDLLGADSWRQADTATIARNFLEDPRLFWPRIDWGAPGPGYVEAEFQLFPFVVSLLYRLLGEDPLLGRLLSLALVGLASLVLHRLARRWLDPAPALAAVALFLCAPLIFRYSRAFMPEATVLLFYLLTVERFLASLDDRRLVTLLQAAGAGALAILVKPTAIHVLLPLMLVALAYRNEGRGHSLARLGLLLALVLLPAAAWYAHAVRLHLEFGNTFGVISGGDSKWGGPRYWLDPRFYVALVTIDRQWILGLGGSLLAVIGLLIHRRPDWRLFMGSWALTVLLYYLLVARYAGSEARGLQYHIYAVPVLALAAGAGLQALAERLEPHSRWGAGLLALVLLALQVRENVSLLGEQPETSTRQQAGLELGRLAAPGQTAVVLSSEAAVDEGVANNYQNPEVFFHAHRRGRVLPLDAQQAPALVRELTTARARWFVNFPALNREAGPGFVPYLAEHLVRAAKGDGWEIWRVP